MLHVCSSRRSGHFFVCDKLCFRSTVWGIISDEVKVSFEINNKLNNWPSCPFRSSWASVLRASSCPFPWCLSVCVPPDVSRQRFRSPHLCSLILAFGSWLMSASFGLRSESDALCASRLVYPCLWQDLKPCPHLGPELDPDLDYGLQQVQILIYIFFSFSVCEYIYISFLRCVFC